MNQITACIAILLFSHCFASSAFADSEREHPKISVLLVDGQNNHNWRETSPLIREILAGTNRFQVTVVTAPGEGEGIERFEPRFADYDLVVSNYNGESWSENTQHAFEQFVAEGGGFVCIHAANNAFPNWQAYNRMIGLGGWGGRNEKHGAYVRWKEEQQRFIRDDSSGRGGAHGARIPFVIVVRDGEHPITKGLPSSFMQSADELYAKLRGPAVNLHVLATGFSAKESGGTGEHEPVLMTVRYGAGRVFHTTLGHDAESIRGLAFQLTLQRGAEWAATGAVTFEPPAEEVLTAATPAMRDPLDIRVAPLAEDIPNIHGDGWVELFNGVDLSGWVQRNGTATYRVEDGIIVGKTAEGSPNSFLCTEKEFADFELTFEVHDDPGLNSGVQIRSLSKADFNNGRVHGPQVEIENSPGESGYVYSEGTGRGWITKEQPIKDAYTNGEWNRYVVRVKGDRIQTWLNGRAIADVRDPDVVKQGFLGLQVHGVPRETGPFQVRWRDIRVREL